MCIHRWLFSVTIVFVHTPIYLNHGLSSERRTVIPDLFVLDLCWMALSISCLSTARHALSLSWRIGYWRWTSLLCMLSAWTGCKTFDMDIRYGHLVWAMLFLISFHSSTVSFLVLCLFFVFCLLFLCFVFLLFAIFFDLTLQTNVTFLTFLSCLFNWTWYKFEVCVQECSSK